MPSDTTSAERGERIREVLQELDLTACADLPIQQLSGGGREAGLRRGGRARRAFGVSEVAEISERLETARRPNEWAGLFHDSRQYREHVRARLAERGNGHSAAGGRRAPQRPGGGLRRTSAMRPFWMLSRRY